MPQNKAKKRIWSLRAGREIVTWLRGLRVLGWELDEDLDGAKDL